LELYYDEGGDSTFITTYIQDGTNGKKTLATAAWTAIFTTLAGEWDPLLKTWEDKDRLVTTAVKLAALYDA